MSVVTNYTIKEFDQSDQLYHTLARDILKILPSKGLLQKPFSMILSGGSSPVNLHQLLVEHSPEAGIDWDKVSFFFSDERCVKPDDELSNYSMAANTLFIPLKLKEKHIFRIKGELPQNKAAETYHQQIKDFFQGDPSFDLALLGMGTDGHTASLFPNSKALDIQDRFAVSAGTGPEGRQRVSLTYRSLNASKRTWVMVTGRGKNRTLNKALDEFSHFRDFPVKAIRPLEELIFYVSP